MFLGEEPGHGSGNLASRYRYNVETLDDGRRVYLVRPANLKLGFDFVVHVEGMRFSKGQTNPTHDDVLYDLRGKRQSVSDRDMVTIKQCCSAVYEGMDPDEVLQLHVSRNLPGYPFEMVLKVLKWLWIEQDIRYWNYSGRRMLKNAVDDALG